MVLPRLALALFVVIPLLAGALFGFPSGFFDSPPLLTKAEPPEPFHPVIFGAFSLAAVFAVTLFFAPRWYGFKRLSRTPDPRPSARFPSWGWLGVFLIAAGWTCAWCRFAWLGPLGNYTFAPLWLGYVLTVDGLAFLRTGTSIVARSPGEFAGLFPASAAIWWYFEFLNRFVRNWWYEGSDVFGPGGYILFATLCFSTVLPAIFETADLLRSFTWFRNAYAAGVPRAPHPRGFIVFIVASSCLALLLLVLLPDETFFLAWLAPLGLAGGALTLAGVSTPFTPLRQGDYSRLLTLAAAAFVCGLFWEMWNYHALPKWRYAVPYVQVLHVFEMPLLGFLGYLPFGPACWCMWSALTGRSEPASRSDEHALRR
jgi:hypothetical protein